MSTCKGRKNGGKFCGEQIDEDNEYCEQHSYFKDYTEEMFENLIKCIRCANMHYKTNLSQCPKCTADSKIKNAKASSKKIHCSGIDRNRNQCREKVLHQGDFCSKHKYLKDYTEHMMNNLKLCSTCRKCFYSETFSTCEICRKERPEMNKERRDEKPKCKHDGCKFEANESGYCGKHENCAEVFKLITENSGKKVCTNYIRGCRNILDNDYGKKKCEKCLQKDRQYDTEKRHTIIQNNVKFPTEMKCIKCNANIGNGYEFEEGFTSQKCEVCFKKQQEIENNRPDRIERREAMKKDVDEHIRYYKKRVIDSDGRLTWGNDMTRDACEKLFKGQCYYCGQKYEEGGYLLGIDRVDNLVGYCKLNCVTCCAICNYMKGTHTESDFLKICQHLLCYHRLVNHYDFHPEVFHERTTPTSFEKYINDIKGHHLFRLDIEVYNAIRKSSCYLCGHIGEHPNGIDRLSSDVPYVLENCNSCCQTCNFVKRESNIKQLFVQFLKIADFRFYKGCFHIVNDTDAHEYNSTRIKIAQHIVDTIRPLKHQLKSLENVDKNLIELEYNLQTDEKAKLNHQWCEIHAKI